MVELNMMLMVSVMFAMMSMVAVMMFVVLSLKCLKINVGGLGEVHERRHSLEVHQAGRGNSVIVDLHD